MFFPPRSYSPKKALINKANEEYEENLKDIKKKKTKKKKAVAKKKTTIKATTSRKPSEKSMEGKKLELEFFLERPASDTVDKVIGMPVTDDAGIKKISSVIRAEKIGKATRGIQKWRAIAELTDPKMLAVFSLIPAFKKRIK